MTKREIIKEEFGEECARDGLAVDDVIKVAASMMPSYDLDSPPENEAEFRNYWRSIVHMFKHQPKLLREWARGAVESITAKN